MAKSKKGNGKSSKAQKAYREAVLRGDIKATAGRKINPQDMTPTSATEWKKAPTVGEGVPLPLPSGNTALVQPLGIPELMKRGLIPNPLISTVTGVLDDADLRMENPSPADYAKADKKRRKKLADEMEVWARNPEMMVAVFDMADNITLACVVKPEVHPVPEPGEDGVVSREASKLYIDEVDLDDKLYIMSYGMAGVRDLDRFREELAGSVGVAPALQVVASETESGDGA